jgi:hypothetical protein
MKFLALPRAEGKTTTVLEEFLKDWENTYVICAYRQIAHLAADRALTRRVETGHPLKQGDARAFHRHFMTLESYVSSSNTLPTDHKVIIDDLDMVLEAFLHSGIILFATVTIQEGPASEQG